MRVLRFVVVVVVSLVGLGSGRAAGPTHEGRPQQAKAAGAETPLEAMRGATLASETRDPKAVRAWLHTETELEAEAADVWAHSTTGQFRVQDAIRERFGDEGLKDYSGGRHASKLPKDPAAKAAMLDALLKEAKVEVDGDKAFVTHPLQPDKPMELRKTRDGWKPLFTSVHGERGPARLRSFIKYNRLMGPAHHKTADEIAEGKYKSVAEIRLVLDDRTTDHEELNRQLERQRQLEEKARQRRKK